MTNGKRTLQILGSIAVIILVASVAQAGTLNVTTTPFTGNDAAPWTGSGPLSSFTVVTGGNVIGISFSNAGFGDGAIFDSGGGGSYGWTIGTVFPSGTLLLGTNNSASINPANVQIDTLTLTFVNPVSAVGAYIQDYDYSQPFTATVSTTSDGTYTSPAESSGVNGNPLFIGITDGSGTADIYNITFSTSQPTSGGTPDYFVIGAAQFNDGNGTIITPPTPPNNPPAGTPEPASLMMVGGGIAGLAWKARKRVRA